MGNNLPYSPVIDNLTASVKGSSFVGFEDGSRSL